MADIYGNLYFSWVQCSLLCIPDSSRISANSNWQIAISQTQLRKAAFVFLRDFCGKRFPVFAVSPRLRGKNSSIPRLCGAKAGRP